MNEITELDGADLVQRHWPYDGPHSPERTADALDAASALIRYANNATSTRDGLGYAGDVYRSIGGLAEALDRLPQLLTQLAEWADRASVDATLRHDEHRADDDRGAAAGRHAAHTASQHLHAAAMNAYANSAHTVSLARRELAHLCHDLPDE